MTELNIANKHVIAILLDNEFGALARVVSLFSARGYNIETLTVAVVNEKKNLSRITITTYGDQAVINLIIKLLERLVPVHSAVDLSNTTPHIERGLALVKIKVSPNNREEILRIAEIHGAELVDKEADYFLFEIADELHNIDMFIALLEPFGIIEISRTGSAALALGNDSLIHE